jgi:hypothetical protein
MRLIYGQEHLKGMKDLDVIACSNLMLIKSVTFWLGLAVYELPARKTCKIAPDAFGNKVYAFCSKTI